MGLQVCSYFSIFVIFVAHCIVDLIQCLLSIAVVHFVSVCYWSCWPKLTLTIGSRSCICDTHKIFMANPWLAQSPHPFCPTLPQPLPRCWNGATKMSLKVKCVHTNCWTFTKAAKLYYDIFVVVLVAICYCCCRCCCCWRCLHLINFKCNDSVRMAFYAKQFWNQFLKLIKMTKTARHTHTNTHTLSNWQQQWPKGLHSHVNFCNKMPTHSHTHTHTLHLVPD